MNKKDRKKSVGMLRLKGTLNGVSVSRTECDKHGYRSSIGAIFTNKNDFMKFIVANYWGKPTNPNGGDT